jgi:hypothetical protein
MGHYSAGIIYAEPSANEYYAQTYLIQQALNANTTELYDSDGGSDPLGANLTDVTKGYIALLCVPCMQDNTGTAGGGNMQAHIREGAGASTTAATGAIGLSSFIRENSADSTYVHTGVLAGTPGGTRESEWGVDITTATTNTNDRVRFSGGTLIVLPAVSGSFTGSTLGTEDQEWSACNPAGISYNDQTGGDADQTSSDDWTVSQAGEYLCIFGFRWNNGGTIHDANIRAYWQIDGVDVFGVYTGNATSGAVKTGRGYQLFCDGNLDTVDHRPFLCQAGVFNLAAGANTLTIVANRHESSDPASTEAINASANNICIRTDRFKTFEYTKVSTARSSPANEVYATDGDFTTNITVDGNAKVMVIFSTTIHYNGSEATIFKIYRNGSLIGFYDDGAFGGNQANPGPTNVFWNSSSGTTSVGDSDNQTLPVTLILADDPGAGTHSYTVQTASFASSSTGIYNANDNGGDGFNGFMILAELALPV